jgi:hypothetical protein
MVRWLLEERGWRKEVEKGEKGEGQEEVQEERGEVRMGEGREKDMEKTEEAEVARKKREEEGRREVAEVIEGAARGRHLDILQWAKEESLLCPPKNYFGNLEVLKWLRKETDYEITARHVTSALRDGNAEILNWLISETPELRKEISEYTGLLAMCWCLPIRKNSMDLLKWVQENFGMLPTRYKTPCNEAALQGNFEIFKYLRNLGFTWTAQTSACIATGGNFEILKWAREHGCPWDEETCSSAVRHFGMLKWARENGCPWNEHVCSEAAQRGKFEILKWVREHECPWNEDTCASAAGSGNLEILKWALEQGCPWDDRVFIDSMEGKHFEILDWVFMNGFGDPGKIFKYAARTGLLDAFEWITKNLPRDACDSDYLARVAVTYGHVHLLEWMENNGVPFPEDFPVIVKNCVHIQVMLWRMKKNIPEEFRGFWREVEEEWMSLLGGEVDMNEKAREVLQDPGKVEDFIMIVKEKLK